MAPANRWHKVLERYIALIAARVDGLGGDSDSIQPSPNRCPIKPGRGPDEDEREYRGKVCEVLYDCFGDFEGFVLGDCHESRSFHTPLHAGSRRSFCAAVARA